MLLARCNIFMLPDVNFNPPVRSQIRPAYPKAICVGEFSEGAIHRVSDKSDTDWQRVGNTHRLGSTYS